MASFFKDDSVFVCLEIRRRLPLDEKDYESPKLDQEFREHL
jgi:hypothetical protein